MKFNPKSSVKKSIETNPDLTENYEGGIAFKMPALERLYTRTASCLVGEPKFYKESEDGVITAENQDKLLLNDIQEVAHTNPEFILKLAAYARNELHLRSVSVLLLVEASLIPACKPFVRKYTPRIVQRADELAEVVAYLQSKIGHIGNKSAKGSMPSALKKGLADSFHNFDEYQFSKYNRKGVVKLKDVLKITHPKPKNAEESELFKRIKEDSLKTPETWEVEISTKGSTKENWEKIMPKMGYMALLRNLRNFLDKKVDLTVPLKVIPDNEQVRKSKQLPFRFLSAYRELEGNDNPEASKVLDVLEYAMDSSVENLTKLSGTTFAVSDNSGSMDSKLSEKSSVSYADVSNALLAIAHKICENPITGIFGERFAIKQFSKRNGVLSNIKSIRNGEVGHSTDAYLSVKYLNENKIKVDRIIVFSDMQCYDSHGYSDSLAAQVRKYRASINPNVYVYSVDLAGYGTLQIPKDEAKTCLIAGWSERILEFINVFETEKKTAVDKIMQY